MPHHTVERLEPSDDSSEPSAVDYSERRSLPVTIPDYQTVDRNGEHFVVSLCMVSHPNKHGLVTLLLIQ